jgi:hypothetical protein
MAFLRWTAIIGFVFTIGFMSQNAQAQFQPPKFLKAAAAAPKSVEPGKTFTLTIAVTVDTPYHIQANPTKEGYIATELEVGAVKGFKVGKVTYPKALETKIGGETLPVYEGKVEIKAEVTPEKSLKPGKVTLPLTLKYQGCNEKACFPPATTKLQAVVNVGKASAKMSGVTKR